MSSSGPITICTVTAIEGSETILRKVLLAPEGGENGLYAISAGLVAGAVEVHIFRIISGRRGGPVLAPYLVEAAYFC
jgi:hypothetical protein